MFACPQLAVLSSLKNTILEQLAVAIAEDYGKRYREYDWTPNDGSDADLFQ